MVSILSYQLMSYGELMSVVRGNLCTRFTTTIASLSDNWGTRTSVPFHNTWSSPGMPALPCRKTKVIHDACIHLGWPKCGLSQFPKHCFDPALALARLLCSKPSRFLFQQQLMIYLLCFYCLKKASLRFYHKYNLADDYRCQQRMSSTSGRPANWQRTKKSWFARTI